MTNRFTNPGNVLTTSFQPASFGFGGMGGPFRNG